MRISTSLSTLFVSFVLFSSGAKAGVYEALCGGFECRVTVTPENIISPFGVIPPNRVTSWGGAGDSSTSVGTGVATTLLLGPVGLVGFFAKNHDFDFLVSGYNEKGKKTYLQIQFKNNKPAKEFASEMFQVTGLGMGETRSTDEIRRHQEGRDSDDLQSETQKTTTFALEADSTRKKLEPTGFTR